MNYLFYMISRPTSPFTPQPALVLAASVSVLFWWMQVWQWSGTLTQPVEVTLFHTAAQTTEGNWARLFTGALTTQGLASASVPQWTGWQLLGVVSSHSGAGIAMLVSPAGEELMVRTSEALLPGVYLLEVHDQHVLIGASLQDAVTLKQLDK
jgi:hypothetical protein